MRNTLLASFAALLFVGAAGCSSPVEPPVPETPEDPSVNLVLRAGDIRQRALLTEVRAADDDRPYSNAPFETLIQTAQVRVGAAVFQLLEEQAVDYDTAAYNYYSDSLSVAPGETYDLHVQLKGDGGRTVRGQTTVPGASEGRAEGLRLTWSASEGAARYRVLISTSEDSPSRYYEDTFTTDTTFTVQPDEDFAPGEHIVRITAISETLSAFMDDETARAGLEGAYGVFGAVTIIRGTVTLGEDSGGASTAAAQHLR